MALLDKLHAMADADPDTDLLKFFGVGPGEFHWDGKSVTVGDETVSTAEARAALAGPVRQTSCPARTVVIGDL
jgi:hypothetical protein